MQRANVIWHAEPEADVCGFFVLPNPGAIPLEVQMDERSHAFAVELKPGLIGPPNKAVASSKIVKVVVVDDSPLVRSRVAGVLGEVANVEIVGLAESVSAGKVLVQQQRPDVLILDIDFPGENGLDLLQFAHTHDRALTIVMLSNNDHPRLRAKCAELGARHYFYKPDELEQTAEVCRKLASSQGPSPSR